MRRLSSIVLLLLITLSRTSFAQIEPPTEPQAILVTIGPGDEVWEKFGHNMLWLRSPERGIDLCYNWGLFDFDQPGFIRNFVRGRSVYSMDGIPARPMLGLYAEQKRHVIFQRLRLSTEQINRLIDLCEENRKPENQEYRYDYFRDNCCTRVRDMIDRVTDGALQPLKTTYSAREESYRWHSLRLTQDNWLTTLGIDFTLGPDGDRRLSAWDKAFLPMKLAKYVEPWVEETTEWPGDRPDEPQTPPIFWPWLGAVGVVIAAAIIWVSRWRRWSSVAIGLWWGVAGLAGVFMTFMWCFTDHTATYRNANLWQFSPIALIGVGFLVFRRPRETRVAALALLAIAIIGFLLRLTTLSSQQNWDFICLALPIHAAVAWVIRSRELTRDLPPGEVASTL